MARTAIIAFAMLPSLAQIVLTAGCAAPPGSPPSQQQLDPPRNGPETGSAQAPVDAKTGHSIEHDALLSRMSAATVVYLGEKHDNSQHHQLQLWTLRELIAHGQRPLLGLEMFTTADTRALAEFTHANHENAQAESAIARLQRATGMHEVDDERWSRYGPLLRLAREQQLTVFGIDLPIALRSRVSRVGIEGLTSIEREALPALDDEHLGIERASAYREQMLSRLKAAHCGYGSRAYLLRLLQNWEARNETMARAIATAATSGGRDAPVLIVLGGQHVRNGEGVVPRLARHLPDAQQLIVSFITADELREASSGRDQRSVDTGKIHGKHSEVLWPTAQLGQSMEDACKAFQQSKEKGLRQP